MSAKKKIDHISVVVPQNPFMPPDLTSIHHVLCALDVEKLMAWWPGIPHTPNRELAKIKAIQRSLDWKRVAQIAAYLLQEEIPDSATLLDEVFGPIYEPRKNEPGREWPPRIKGTIKYSKSSFPVFSNILVHVNGAKAIATNLTGTVDLDLDANSSDFYLRVIDGQHRVNGAFLALKIKQKTNPKAVFEMPAEVFLDLDPIKGKPVRQAQITMIVRMVLVVISCEKLHLRISMFI